jgi:hypothetical protein
LPIEPAEWSVPPDAASDPHSTVMAHISSSVRGHRRFGAAILLGGLLGLGVACSSGESNGRPRVASIPMQVTTGGSTFSLDVSDYVTEREGETVTYSVTSGGGSFAGSTYSRMFPALGDYTVAFTASDSQETTTGTFQVRVTTSNFAVVQVGGDFLALLDTDTDSFVTFSSSDDTETFKAGLSLGHTVFERNDGGDTDLFVYDPLAAQLYTLGDTAERNETFVAVTSDDKVIFETATATDSDLFIWNPRTRVSRIVRAVTGERDEDAVVLTGGLIAFEGGVDDLAEIFLYDAADDELTRVTDTAVAENVVAATPNGGLVFDAPGAGGERDLFYYKAGVGVVEIGADQTALQTVSRTYQGAGSQDQIVFTATVSGVTRVWYWEPSTGASTDISVGAANDVNAFNGITQGDHAVFTATDGTNGGTDIGVRALVPSGSTVAIPNAGNATDTFAAVTRDGSTDYVVLTRSGDVLVYNVQTPGTDTETSGGALEVEAALGNGDVVFRRTDGSEIFHYDPATGTATSAGTGAGVVYVGAGSAAGDFCFTKIVSMQTDLFMWDLSATTEVTVSDDAAADTFQYAAVGGEIVFARPVGTNTTTDLFSYDPVADDETQLSPVFPAVSGQAQPPAQDHVVVGGYSATRVN